jgi:hypothetical protein
MKRKFITTLLAISMLAVTTARAGILDDWGKAALVKQFFMEYRIKFHQDGTHITSITLDRKGKEKVRERLEHTARNLPGGFEQQTVVNLLADPDGLELVCEPYSDLEPRFAVYQALYKLFIG